MFRRRHTRRKVGKIFKAADLAKKEADISELITQIANVCDGKPMVVVEEALNKLQELTY